ncbi:RING finger protein 150-like protein [Dinothrombium tinctorium]|uniref:RING finger protein 150-like protein n=1 Tax=Dinothrombium tinctorium TaxID=1965070 RepID=A0A443QWF3_9ACAR|nr:RING finger protein 150-like protein [Dinothrombium tinctorium]
MHSTCFLREMVLFVVYLVVDCKNSIVLGDIAYAYETDDVALAIINVSYIDPITGVLRNDREEVGKFSVGKIGSVNGVVVHFNSHDACDPIDGNRWPSEPWIALTPHGICTETQKLRNIANTNASAAVMYDIKPGPKIMRVNHKAIDLISVFISKEKGEEISLLVNNGTRVILQITIGTHNTFRYANINKTSVLFVSVSFAILMIISLAWLVFYYIQRFRYIHAKDILTRRLCNAAKKALEKIPTKTVRLTDLQSSDFVECCAVCIEAFKVGDIIRIIPCKHMFHKTCVDPWLLDQRSCPMCKLDILKHYGIMCEMTSQESVFNIDEFDIHQQYWRSQYGRGSGDIEIVHVPINVNHNRHTNRSQRSRLGGLNNENQVDSAACSSNESQACENNSLRVQLNNESIKISVENHNSQNGHSS